MPLLEIVTPEIPVKKIGCRRRNCVGFASTGHWLLGTDSEAVAHPLYLSHVYIRSGGLFTGKHSLKRFAASELCDANRMALYRNKPYFGLFNLFKFYFFNRGTRGSTRWWPTPSSPAAAPPIGWTRRRRRANTSVASPLFSVGSSTRRRRSARTGATVPPVITLWRATYSTRTWFVDQLFGPKRSATSLGQMWLKLFNKIGCLSKFTNTFSWGRLWHFRP